MNQELNLIDRLHLSIIYHEMELKEATRELSNHNLTEGETRALHVEIEKLKFCIKTLNFISND